MNPAKIAETTANKTAALTGLERLLELRPDLAGDEEKLSMLAHLFAGSEFLTQWLFVKSGDIDWLIFEDRLAGPRSVQEMKTHLDELLAEQEPLSALRRFKHRELCRIAARELSGTASLEDTLKEWSQVADIAVDTALTTAQKNARKKYGTPVYTDFEGSEEKEAGICAIAMGKLGGYELNISSDIDIIFVHSSDNGETKGKDDGSGIISLHEFFVLIAQEAARLLNDVTQDGFVFRVDLDLRPEGTRGEITNSVGAMEIYYESWGQQWERQALIKARYCGGSRKVADEVIDRLHPFVYRKYLDQKAIDEIASIKRRIDQSLLAAKGPKRAGRDIKLGRGGIREIEFAVQSLQLLYGARSQELQTASTLEALKTCNSLGLLSTPHYIDLKEAYIFYRRLENRIQYHQGIQTHLIPENAERQETVANQLGVKGADKAKSLLSEVERKRKRVRKIFDIFFAKPDKEPVDVFPIPLDDEAAATDWLDSLGFDEPKKSARALNFLRNGRPFTHPSESSRSAFDRFGPLIVAEAITTPWPDHVLTGFDELVNARGGRDMLYDLLEKYHPVIKLLSAIFSSSEHLTRILLRHPDILDRMLVADPVGMPADRIMYRREFQSGFTEFAALEKKVESVNSFRIAEMLRLGLRGLLGLADRFETMDGLTMLTEEYLKALAQIACQQVDASQGPCADVEWTILAAGKLGRREMNFGSDVDLLVFFEGCDCAGDYATRLSQTIIKLSGMMTSYGAGYQIDMRLRPEGDMGTLVTSYDAMVGYYEKRGVAWERLALVGARPIAGCEAFGNKVMEVIRSFIFSDPLSPAEAENIAGIRERIADEKVKPGVVDIKFGRGGMIEIEFICQWLRMESREAQSEKEEEKPFTMTTLKKAKEEGWLQPEVTDELIQAYLLYRSIEDSLRMDSEQAVSQLPQSGLMLRRVARKAGGAGFSSGKFIDHVKTQMGVVRKLYLDFIDARMH